MLSDPRFEGLFVPIALGVVVVLLLVIGILSRRRAKAAAIAAARMGAGSALACALDGDLDGARRILEDLLRNPGNRTPDAVVGLISVLRSQQEWSRAVELLDRLSQGQNSPWINALRVRLALDTDDLARALELVEADPNVPSELAVAAYARSGRWNDALGCYRKRTPRKERQQTDEANLLAGAAVELARGGDERGARKALKKAHALGESALLVALATKSLSAEADQEETETIKVRLPWLFPAEGTVIAPDEAARDILQTARSSYEEGKPELALGQLRDALEERPELHAVRMQYVDWILDVGEPNDWRTELSEVLEMLHRLEPHRVRPCCTGCGFCGMTAFAVCPRCNAVGSVVADTLQTPSKDGVTDMSALVAVARFWGHEESTTGVDSAKR